MEKEIQLQHLPIIDWELGSKLVGGKKEIAKEMIDILVKSLPIEIKAIKQLQSDKNHIKLIACVHKLHGAVSYCGTPRLKIVVAALETNLKNNIMVSSSLLNQLDIEVNLLLDQHAQNI